MDDQTDRTSYTVGDALLAARKAQGLLQADVAKRVGCSQGWISHVERGQVGVSLRAVQAFVRAGLLDVTILPVTPDDAAANDNDAGSGDPKVISARGPGKKKPAKKGQAA